MHSAPADRDDRGGKFFPTQKGRHKTQRDRKRHHEYSSPQCFDKNNITMSSIGNIIYALHTKKTFQPGTKVLLVNILYTDYPLITKATVGNPPTNAQGALLFELEHTTAPPHNRVVAFLPEPVLFDTLDSDAILSILTYIQEAFIAWGVTRSDNTTRPTKGFFTTDVRTIHPSTYYPDESRYIRHGDVFVENMTNTITEFNARTLARSTNADNQKGITLPPELYQRLLLHVQQHANTVSQYETYNNTGMIEIPSYYQRARIPPVYDELIAFDDNLQLQQQLQQQQQTSLFEHPRATTPTDVFISTDNPPDETSYVDQGDADTISVHEDDDRKPAARETTPQAEIIDVEDDVTERVANPPESLLTYDTIKEHADRIRNSAFGQLDSVRILQSDSEYIIAYSIWALTIISRRWASNSTYGDNKKGNWWYIREEGVPHFINGYYASYNSCPFMRPGHKKRPADTENALVAGLITLMNTSIGATDSVFQHRCTFGETKEQLKRMCQLVCGHPVLKDAWNEIQLIIVSFISFF